MDEVIERKLASKKDKPATITEDKCEPKKVGDTSDDDTLDDDTQYVDADEISCCTFSFVSPFDVRGATIMLDDSDTAKANVRAVL